MMNLMMRVCVLIILVIGALADFFLLPAPASAYEFPPYQEVTLKISGNISENYSNNITYASDNENKVEDFTTMMNLGLDFQYTGKTRFLGFYGSLARELFKPSSDVRNPSENANLIFKNEFSPYDRISLNNNFSHTRVPVRDQGGFDADECRKKYQDQGLPSDEVESFCNEHFEEFGRFKGRFDSYSNSSRVVYVKTISKYFDMSPGYSYRKNWSNDEGTKDADHHSITLNANYKYSEPTSFLLAYSYRMSLYDGGNDISRQSITAGIRQYITRRIYFNGNIGADFAMSESGDDSITANATLTGELDEKTSANLSYSQGTTISANTDDTFENWQITGRLSRLLLEDFNSSVSAFYGKGDYSATNVSDTLTGASINLSYNFWRSKRGSTIKGNAGYSYSNLDSTDSSREYSRNSIKSSLTLAF